MNKRIRKLADQCRTEHRDGNGGYIEQFDEELFTKLIMEYCADQCDLLLDHKISSEWSRGTHDCARAIRKLLED